MPQQTKQQLYQDVELDSKCKAADTISFSDISISSDKRMFFGLGNSDRSGCAPFANHWILK